MESDRILAKTLIGLRNIAWAAAATQHDNKNANFLKTATTLLIEDVDHLPVVRLALRMSPMVDIPPLRNVHGRWDTSPVIKEDHPSLTATERNK